MGKWSKIVVVFLAFVLTFASFVSTVEASDRHGAVRAFATEDRWTGISADIVLPRNVNVTSGYVNWYLGLGETVVESGISRTKDGYKVFLGTGSRWGEQYWSSEFDPNIKDGDRVNLKLINNNNGTISLYVNNTLRYLQPLYNPSRLKTFDKVKMVHGVDDYGTSSFSQASFSNVQLRANTSGSIYVPWDGSIPYRLDRYDDGTDFTVFSGIPLSTSLSAK